VGRVRRLAVLAVLVPALAGSAGAGGSVTAGCAPPAAEGVSAGAIDAALRAGRDVWGERLLAAPGGPTLAGARQYLGPLVLARAAGRSSLTTSGVAYLPFGVPVGVRGAANGVALHLTDGSEILARRVGGPSLRVSVGANGGEAYGSCRRRLAGAELADGWLPILETSYVDGAGVRYRQESFTARGETGLTSYVRLAADTSAARGAARAIVRFPGGSISVPIRGSRTFTVSWPVGSKRAGLGDAGSYDTARASLVRYWQGRLAEGMAVDVPERPVMDAARALRVQDLLLTWRYSIGNAYEEFSFPEGVDVAQVLGEQGYEDVARAILRTSLTRSNEGYPNWKMGEKLLGSATHFRLFRDRAYLTGATPALRGYVATLGRQIDASATGLLGRERYSSDIHDPVYGLHSQAVVWAGLRGMADAWAQSGQTALAARCRSLAARLAAGLRRAVLDSQRRLPDGSLFVPVRLLGDEEPYASLMEARAGSYWNLVMPYALAARLLSPEQEAGVWRYMQLHGSRLLGLVRAGAYALYGREAPFPVSGTDQVYGINASRFLADRGEADQLVLSLYGQLAAAMTPGTFVAGEAASVAPVPGGERTMYLPPNGAANGAFLETLRLMLVHETPDGIELAYSTPRAWLAPGKRVGLTKAPTAFGPVSFSIATRESSADVAVQAPSRSKPRTLKLRLRLPDGRRIASVTLGGRPYRNVDVTTGTIDLSGRSGTLQLRVGFRKRVA
jgi:hypothetical protein